MGKTGREGLDYSEERDAHEEEAPEGSFLVSDNEINPIDDIEASDPAPVSEEHLYGSMAMDKLIRLQELEKEEVLKMFFQNPKEGQALIDALEKKHSLEIEKGHRYKMEEFVAMGKLRGDIAESLEPEQNETGPVLSATNEPPEQISVVSEDIGGTVVPEDVATVAQGEETSNQETENLSYFDHIKSEQEQGHEIPAHVIWTVLDKGKSEEKRWAAEKIRERRNQGIEDGDFAASAEQIEELKKNNLFKEGKVYSAKHAAKVLKDVLSVRGIKQEESGESAEETVPASDEVLTQQSSDEYTQPEFPLNIESSATVSPEQEVLDSTADASQDVAPSESEYTQTELPLEEEEQKPEVKEEIIKETIQEEQSDVTESAEKSEEVLSNEKKEKAEVKPIDEKVLAKFEADMGISKEVLENLEGFSSLSRGQQLLALENLKKTAAADIGVEGLKAYNENLKSSGLLGKMWKGMTKQYQVEKEKAEIAKKWRKGKDGDALAMKMNTLGGIAKLIKGQEFNVTEKDGNLSVEYASKKLFNRELTAAEKNKLRWFNQTANALENESFEKTTGDAKAIRAAMEERYKSALKDVAELFGDDVKSGIEWQQKVRSAVGMNRLFAENPNFEKELAKSPGMMTFLSAMNTGVERGVIMAGSAGLRVAAVGAMGTIGMFAAAPIVGAVLGARREKQSHKEKDLLTRIDGQDTKITKSEIDTMSEKAKKAFMEKKEKEKKTGKNFMSADALAKKLSDDIEQLDTVDENETMEIAKRGNDGRILRDESGNIIKETISKKVQLQGVLSARIEYTKRKLDEQLVSLGKTPAERITMVNDLMESLGLAEARLIMEKPAVKSQLESRLNHFLDIREEKIDKNRQKAILKAGAKGAAISLGFAAVGTGVGTLLRSAGEHLGVFGGAKVSSMENLSQSIGPKDSSVPVGEVSHIDTPPSLADSPVSPTSQPVFDEMMRPHNPPSTVYDMSHPAYENIAGPELTGSNAQQFVNIGETAPLQNYSVASGDNLTHILKTEIPALQSLSSFGKENAIRNLLNALSPDELKNIGIESGNPDLIHPGQTVNLQRITELLQEKQIHGENLIQHAQTIELNQGIHHAAEAMTANVFSGKSDYVNSLYENAVFGHQPTGAGVELLQPLGGEFDYVNSLYEDAVFGKNPSAGEYMGPWKADTSSLSWDDLPDEVRISHAEAMANMSLEEDIHRIFGEPNPLQKWPIEWENIRGRNMIDVFKEIQEYRLAKDTGVMEAGRDYSVISKLSDYLEEKEFTLAHDHMLYLNETAEEFLTRNMMNDYLQEPHPSTSFGDTVNKDLIMQTGAKSSTFHGYGVETQTTIDTDGNVAVETPYGGTRTVPVEQFSEKLPPGHHIEKQIFNGYGVQTEQTVVVDEKGNIVEILESKSPYGSTTTAPVEHIPQKIPSGGGATTRTFRGYGIETETKGGNVTVKTPFGKFKIKPDK